MKVKDVLARIGDAPLVQALEERGFVVLGDEDEVDAMNYLEDRGYQINDHGANIEEGWLLWRSESPLFPEWLRNFFWISIGRNP